MYESSVEWTVTEQQARNDVENGDTERYATRNSQQGNHDSTRMRRTVNQDYDKGEDPDHQAGSNSYH